MIALTLRFPAVLYAKIDAKAKASGRTFAGEVREALIAWVKK